MSLFLHTSHSGNCLTSHTGTVCFDQLPVSCAAGSNIQNLIFNVTDSDGSVDATIHDDEKSECFHTMSIDSGSGNIQSGIRYAFIHGSCRVPTLSVPENESVFSFRVFHSRYPELHVNLEVVICELPYILQHVSTIGRTFLLFFTLILLYSIFRFR